MGHYAQDMATRHVSVGATPDIESGLKRISFLLQRVFEATGEI